MHDASWRKSAHSGGNGGACVEVAPVALTVALRDSKLDTTGDFPYLSVDRDTFAGLLASVKAGSFDG